MAVAFCLLFEVHPLIILVALAMPIGLKTAATHFGPDDAPPQRALRRVQRLLILPGVLLLTVSGAILLGARSALGFLAQWMLGLTSLSLWGLGLGLMSVSAGFLGLAHIWAWSKHSARSHDQAERELIWCRTQLAKLHKAPIGDEALSQGLPMRHRLPPATRPTGTRSDGVAVVTLGVLMLFPSCSPVSLGAEKSDDLTTASSQSGSPQELGGRHTDSGSPPTDLDLFLDWSGSLRPKEFKSTVEDIIDVLPQTVEQHHITRLTAYAFADDGFRAGRLFSLNLPQLPQRFETEAAEAKVFRLFGNLRDAAAAGERQSASKDRSEQLRDYRSRVRETIGQLNAAQLLPSVSRADTSHCTDIAGLLSRLHLAPGPRSVVSVILSDLHHTCPTATSTQRPGTSHSVRVVVYVVPGRIGSSTLAQYESRVAWLRDHLPSVEAEPFFAARNLTEAVKSTRVAESMWANDVR
jgi:hypothetical protein